MLHFFVLPHTSLTIVCMTFHTVLHQGKNTLFYSSTAVSVQSSTARHLIDFYAYGMTAEGPFSCYLVLLSFEFSVKIQYPLRKSVGLQLRIEDRRKQPQTAPAERTPHSKDIYGLLSVKLSF